MVLKYYPYIFNQVVICGVRGLEASRHFRHSRVRGDQSFAVIEVERVKLFSHSCVLAENYRYLLYKYKCPHLDFYSDIGNISSI